MGKDEFLIALRSGLTGLPQSDIESSVGFYSEIIDDHIEDGMSEEEATAKIGSVDDVIKHIMSEMPLISIVKAKVKPGRVLRVWEIVLLILGFPVWFPLIMAAIAVILSAYMVIWSLVVSMYAVNFALAASSIAGFLTLALYIPAGNFAGAAFGVGIGCLCAGLTIFLFIGINQITKLVLIISRKILQSIKACFIGKGRAQ